MSNDPIKHHTCYIPLTSPLISPLTPTSPLTSPLIYTCLTYTCLTYTCLTYTCLTYTCLTMHIPFSYHTLTPHHLALIQNTPFYCLNTVWTPPICRNRSFPTTKIFFMLYGSQYILANIL